MNIKFDNYDIDLDALNQDLAESSSAYLDSKRWAKDPEARARWNQAYNDINSRGITGFSTSNGRYTLSHNGIAFEDPDGYYADAANFIISRAKNILNASKAKEAEPKNLEEFGKFQERLGAYIMNTNYGGDSNLMRRHWNSMDSHDEYELYETTKRKAALKKALQDYKVTLEDNKYSFEGTSYKDLNDLKTKIDAAIVSLDNPNNTDYTALHQLGIDENLWFPTNEEAANETRTAAQKELEEENKAKQAQETALINQKRANQYKTLRFINMSKLNGTPPSGQDVEARLSGYASLPKLNGQQQSELIGAFKYAKRKGLLQNLDKDELSKFGDIYINNPTRLKKVKGINGFYYDSIGNRIIQPFQGAAPQQSLQDVINENNPEAIAKRQQELQNNKKLSDEDWDIIGADTISMLGDIVSLGGGYAGVAGGLTTIISDLYADIKRGKDFWDTAKNLAKNTAWGFAGLIPGVKLARLGKRAAQLYALYNSFGIITDPDVHKSWKKLINGEDFTSHDFENLKWTLHAFTGAHNTYRGYKSNKSLEKTLNKGKVEVETKSGNKKSITLEQQKEINKAGGRGGQEAANKKFNEIVKEEAKEGSFEFNSENKKWYNPSRYSQKLRNAISDEKKLEGKPIPASKMTIGRILVQDRNKPILANPFLGKTYKNWFTEGGPNRGYATMALGKTYQGLNNTKQNNNSLSSTNTNESNNKAKDPKINPSLNHGQGKNSEGKIVEPVKNPEPVSYNRETMSRYNDAINGRFGKESLQSGNVKVGGNGDLKVVQQTDGTYNIYFKGNQIGNERNQVEIQRVISSVIKQLNKKDSQFGKVSAKEMGEILRSLKAKGWLRHGGKLIKV